MIRTFTNLDTNFSIASCYSTIIGYILTPSGNSVSFSSTHHIKIYFNQIPNFLENKNIIKAKLTCVFETLSVHPIFSLTKTSGDIIDIIDTSNNNDSVVDVGNYTFVTFDITSFVNSFEAHTEIQLVSSSSTSINFFGFNYINNINSQSSSPLKYIQFTHFDNNGKKDTTSFSSFDIGSAGAADVSLTNGNLIFSSPTLISNLVKTSYNISLCFNSIRSNNLKTGVGFRINTDWLFESINSNLITINDPTNQKLLYELLTPSNKQLLSIDIINDVYYCFENNTYLEKISNNSYKYHFLDKSIMDFSIINGQIVFSNLVLSNGEEIIFTYDQNSPTSLISVETPDDLIEIEYADGKISKFISTKKYIETSLTYFNNYLIKIDTYRKKYIASQYPNMSSTLVRSVQLSYSDSHLTGISNLLERRRLLFVYTDNKITNVKECPFDEENVNYTPRNTYFMYGDSYTKVMFPSEHDIYYFFNNYQRLIHVLDDKGNVVHYNYKVDDDDEIRQGHLLASTLTSSLNLYNLVTNGSFECTPFTDGWTIDSLSFSSHSSDQCVAGERCLLFDNTGVAAASLYQTFNNFESDTYVFTGKYKIANSGVSNYQAKVNIQYYETIYVWVPALDNSGVATLQESTVLRNIDRQVILSSTEAWNDFIIDDLSIPANATIKIEFIVPVNGKIYLDDISFSNKKLGLFNYIKNSSFESISSTNNLPTIWTINPTTSISSINSSQIIDLPSYSNLLQKKTIVFNQLTIPTTRNISQHIYISGNKGEHLSFVAWIKGFLTTSEKVEAIIKIHKLGGDSSSYEELCFSALTHLKIWQSINVTFISQFAFDYVEISIKQIGFNKIYVDAIQLFRSSLGSQFLYSNDGQLLSQGSRKSSVNESIGSNNKTSVVSGKNGDYLIYQYDENGKEKQIYDNLGNILINDYLENGVIKTITDGNKNIITQEETENGLLTKIDEMGYISKEAFDEFGNLVTYVDSNGTIVRRIFDDHFRATVVERKNLYGSLGKLEAEYNSLNKVTRIQVADGTTYEFQYDEWGRRINSSVNGITFESLTHNSPITNDKSSIISSIISSDDDYSYSVQYEEGCPEHLLLDNSEIFTFKFDSGSQLIKWTDQRNNISGFLNYDFSGLLISECLTNGFEYHYEYDDLEKVQNEQIKVLNDSVFCNYLRAYEFNASTIFGYAYKLATTTDGDVVIGQNGPQGIFGLNNISGTGDVVDDSTIQAKVLSLEDEKPIKYDLTSINNRLKISGLSGFQIRYGLDTISIHEQKALDGWFYINQTTINKTIFTFISEYSKQIQLKVINSTQLELTVGNTIETINYPSGIYNNWIFLSINIFGHLPGLADIVSFFINGVFYKSILSDVSDLINLDSVIIGGDNIFDDATSLKYALLSIGGKTLSQNLITRIYRSSVKLLFHDHINSRYEGVTCYFNPSSNDDYIPLNGSFASINGLKPIYTNTANGIKSGGNPAFEWDENDRRQIFSSFDEAYCLSGASTSLLTYDFEFNGSYFISLEYKLFAINTSTNRTILSLSNKITGDENARLFIDGSEIKFTIFNTTSTIGYAPFQNIWDRISIKVNGNSLSIYNSLNNLVYSGTALSIKNNVLCSIGCSINNTNHLNGYIKNIVYNKTGSIPSLLTIEGQKCLYKYDSLGRKKNSYIGGITKAFTY